MRSIASISLAGLLAAACGSEPAGSDPDATAAPADATATSDSGAPDAPPPDGAECPEGYSGPDCAQCAEGYVPLDDQSCSVDPCPAIDCGQHGTCRVDGGTGAGWCECDDGYGGEACADCAEGFFPAGDGCVSAVRFALPVANPGGTKIDGNVIGFDNDPEVGTSDLDCLSFDGLAFPHCYDQHTGSDFILTGGFLTMDTGSTAVLAAADGEVIDTHDGEFDRCQANIFTQDIECPGYPGVTPANYVKLRHGDGSETWYWHLKKESVLVAIGETVACGDPLALVGSSGYSSMPHLHFTVIDAEGYRVDPFAGPYSQPDSLWVEQVGAYGLPGALCP